MRNDFSDSLRHFDEIWRRVERDHGHRPPPPPPGRRPWPGAFPPPPPPPPPPPGGPCLMPGKRPPCRAWRFNPHGFRY